MHTFAGAWAIRWLGAHAKERSSHQRAYTGTVDDDALSRTVAMGQMGNGKFTGKKE
jgi:hypothetical protein